MSICTSPYKGDNIEVFADVLWGDEPDGYLQVCQNHPKKGFIVLESIHSRNAKEGLVKYRGYNDVYVTPNTFRTKYKRTREHVWQYRTLFVDLDVDKIGMDYKSPLYEACQIKGLHLPNIAVFTGGGYHVYYKTPHAPNKQKLTDMYNKLEKRIVDHLKYVGADPARVDSSSVLRIPDTYNTKRGNKTYVVSEVEPHYEFNRMGQAIKEVPMTPEEERIYNNYKKKQDNVIRLDSKRRQKNEGAPFAPSTLNLGRLRDLDKICRYRDYDMEGYRHSILHLTALFSHKVGKSAMQEAIKRNQTFKVPQNEKEVIRTVNSAINEDDKDTLYQYCNTTIINMLDITELDQRNLETIISPKEKNRRDKERKKKNRRDEEGKTDRQKEYEERVHSIRTLTEEGYKPKYIAKELGVSKRWVQQIKKDYCIR